MVRIVVARARWRTGGHAMLALIAGLTILPLQSAADVCTSARADDIAELFEAWDAALTTQHPDRVTRLYASEAILIPSSAAPPRSGYAEIRDYYVHLLQRRPRLRVADRNIRIGCNQAIDTGTAAMILRGEQAGTTETLMVRYTLVHEWANGGWHIAHHSIVQLPDGRAVDRLTHAHAPLPGNVRNALPTARAPAVAGFTKRASPRPQARAKAKAPAPDPWAGYKAGDWSTGQPTF